MCNAGKFFIKKILTQMASEQEELLNLLLQSKSPFWSPQKIYPTSSSHSGPQMDFGIDNFPFLKSNFIPVLFYTLQHFTNDLFEVWCSYN